MSLNNLPTNMNNTQPVKKQKRRGGCLIGILKFLVVSQNMIDELE